MKKLKVFTLILLNINIISYSCIFRGTVDVFNLATLFCFIDGKLVDIDTKKPIEKATIKINMKKINTRDFLVSIYSDTISNSHGLFRLNICGSGMKKDPFKNVKNKDYIDTLSVNIAFNKEGFKKINIKYDITMYIKDIPGSMQIEEIPINNIGTISLERENIK